MEINLELLQQLPAEAEAEDGLCTITCGLSCGGTCNVSCTATGGST
jgi:hypothetical protein